MTSNVLLEHDNAVATLTISNPGKLNAVNAAMWQQLHAALTGLAADASLRCVILRGEGTAFVAGGDLEEIRAARRDIDSALAYHENAGAALRAIEDCPHPTIAAILGPCAGGGLEIACACDLRIAGTGAKFGAPIMKLGFSMYPGELAGILRVAGPAVTREILLEGRLMTAEEASAKGLLTRVVPDEVLMDEALAMAHRIASGAPLAARAHKYWINRLLEGRPLTDAEKRASFDFLDSEDYREGMNAFFEKRPPRFKGR